MSTNPKDVYTYFSNERILLYTIYPKYLHPLFNARAVLFQIELQSRNQHPGLRHIRVIGIKLSECSWIWVNYPSGFHFDPFVGTEELGHLEMVGSIVHQLTRNMKDAQYKDPAFAPYFVDHTAGVYPASAAGMPWTAASMQVKGDPMADLVEDMAAEEPIKYW